MGGLSAAGLAGSGLGLADLVAAGSATDRRVRGDGFGRARSCIVLFMFGAPAHQDTWDLKPRAPAEVRGEFSPIASSVPGITVCEHMPRLATMIDRLAQVRSVTHPDNTHTVAMHYMLTGVRHARPRTNPQNSPDDFPCFGGVANYAAGRWPARGVLPGGLPAAVSLNAPANQVSANNHVFPGFFAGRLGTRFDPLFVSRHASAEDFRPLPAAAGFERVRARRNLRGEIERVIGAAERSGAVAMLDEQYRQAFDLLTSRAARRAFELEREPVARRGRYGMTPFGQGCLLARRLVEAGVRLVTVNWERDDAYWDTHADNFKLHKDPLLPNFDRGLSALLDDLAGRGLLDETLVVCLGEFGRTPRINAKAGRDHWAACNTVVLAGAGIPGGQIYGASDASAAYPANHPVSPESLAATIYHLLGIPGDHELVFADGQRRAIASGQILGRLLSGTG